MKAQCGKSLQAIILYRIENRSSVYKSCARMPREIVFLSQLCLLQGNSTFGSFIYALVRVKKRLSCS